MAAELEKLLPTLPPDVAQRVRKTMRDASAGQAVSWSEVGCSLVAAASNGQECVMRHLVSANGENRGLGGEPLPAGLLA
jgi:hypothetical protein